MSLGHPHLPHVHIRTATLLAFLGTLIGAALVLALALTIRSGPKSKTIPVARVCWVGPAFYVCPVKPSVADPGDRRPR